MDVYGLYRLLVGGRCIVHPIPDPVHTYQYIMRRGARLATSFERGGGISFWTSFVAFARPIDTIRSIDDNEECRQFGRFGS